MRTLVAALVMWVALVAWAVLGKAAHANGTSVQLAATADFLADVVADYESAKNKKQSGGPALMALRQKAPRTLAVRSRSCGSSI